MNNDPTFVYFGHHKCATTWVRAIINLACRDLGLNYVNVHNPRQFDNDIGSFLAQNKIDFISFANAEMSYAKGLKKFRGFHIIRDPRDIVVSAYFSHLHSHPTTHWPELADHRVKLQNASEDEGLFLEMEFRTKEFQSLLEWDYNQRNVLEIKMEEIITFPYETVINAFAYLGLVKKRYELSTTVSFACSALMGELRRKSRGLLPLSYRPRQIPVQQLLNYVYANRFVAKTKGRKPGEEDVTSHYRKGVAGDWKNYFKAEHREYFKEHYSDLLLKLGYEESTDW